jgi:hypothetical protein
MTERASTASRVVRLASSALLAGAMACQPAPAQPEPVAPDEQLGADPSSPPAPEPENHGILEEDVERSAADVTDAEVEAFARAYVAVVELEQKYTSELQAAASPQEAESVQAEAQREMQQAIEGAGMTLVEFEQIGTKANDDEGLRMRVEQKLVELQQPEAMQ